MKTKKRPRKTFSKVMSVVLCFTILISTYAGFFSGFGAAAGKAADIDTAVLNAGEVAVSKGAVQDERSADISVNVAAKPGVVSSSSEEVIEKPIDLILIIDVSNSMTTLHNKDSGQTLYEDALDSARIIGEKVFKLNGNNRIAVGSFCNESYGYKISGGKASAVLYRDMIGKIDDSYFATNYSDYEKMIAAIGHNSGTNTEGGYLVADALAEYANNSAFADRQKIVIVMTDGLPQDRYTDSLVRTTDNQTEYNACPSYFELTELLGVAKRLSERENVISELVFFTGGLNDKGNMLGKYYVGGDDHPEARSYKDVIKSSKTYATMADRIAVMDNMDEFMSVFHGLSATNGAKAIGDLLAVYSGSKEAQYPTNAAELLNAFESVINTVISNKRYDAALDAVYTDIIPEHYDVDESSITVTTGSAKLVRDKQVTIDGVVTTRDVVEWTIGTIPEETQSLNYTINVNDPKLYGIVNVAEQGILTYTETEGTKTKSPLIVQIDEIILAPKGADDYYIFDQGENLDANNQGIAGVLVNDDMLNKLLDESGNGYDSETIVNGHIAGLDGTQASLKLEDYTSVLVDGPKNGQVVLNADGTFTYVPDSSLYEQPVVDFTVDPNGTNEYNYSGTAGWEDSFTYKLDTNGTGGDITTTNTTTTTTTTITPIYGPDLSLVVFEDMKQDGADVEGAAAIGGDLTITGNWTVAGALSVVQEHVLVVGGTITGNVINNGGWKITQNEEWVRQYVAKLREIYTALSRKYASMPADGNSGRANGWSMGVELTADPNHVAGNPHVFYVDSSIPFSQIKFIGNFGDDDIIINISGKDHVIANCSWDQCQGDMSQSKLQAQAIWNFYEAETMTSNSFSFQGCVLAPFATWTAHGGHVNGVVIVENMIGDGGFEYHLGSNLNKIAGGITVDIVTNTNTSTSTEVITTTTTMENYVVSGNEDVKVRDALESEIITVHIRVLPNLSELTAVKDSNPANGTLVKSGDTIEYTIEVYNPCSVPVTNVVVNDSAPFGATITKANGGTVDGRNISFTIDKIAANSSAKVSFTVTVDDVITGTNNLANTANIVYTLPGDDTPDSSTTNTVNHAVLTAVKSSSVDASTILAAGDEITYTIAVTNNGTADASDVQVVDTLPDGVTFKDGSGVEHNNGKVTATIGTIAAGQTANISFTVTVNEIGTGSKVIENTATVNGVPTNTTENITKYGNVVVKYVDEEGNELRTSDGASGVTGSDYGPYPAKDIENYRPIRTEGDIAGKFTEGEIVIVHVYAKIPGHATVYYVDESGKTLADPESIDGWQGEEVTDLLKKDIQTYEFVRTDAPTTTLTEEGITIIHVYKLIPDDARPTVGKTSDPANGSLVKSNDTIVYTISVTNNKYEAMTDVVVDDTAPKGTTITDAGNGTVNGDAIRFVIPVIEAGATATVSFTVTVDAEIEGTGNLANTAYVTYRDRESSIDNTIPTNTTGHAILTAVKAGGDAEFYGAGDVYTYYITVTNNGTAAAQSIKVTDTVPEGTTLYNGKDAAVAGDVLTWTIDKLEAGASKTVSFEVQVNDTTEFVSTINNTAYVNDIPTNTTEDIVKKGTVDVKFVDEAGNDLSDALHYEGKPGTAHGTTDAIDIYGYALKTTTGSTDGNFVEGNITIIHVYERLTGTATIHYIDKSSGQDILPNAYDSGWVGDTITSDQWTEIKNYTYVSTEKPEMVFIDGNVDIIHYYTYIKADDTALVIEKASDPISGATVRCGDEITYIITLTNTRVDAVNDVVIEDYIPDGMSFVSASTGAEYSNGKLTWNVGTIPVGASKTVYFTAKVDDELTGYGNLRNVASATYTNRDLEPEDPIYSNEVTHPILDAKLESFTDQPDANLTEGDKIIYKITVTNEGSVEKTNIPVIADIPEGTTFVSSEDGTSDGDSFTTTIPSLKPGETVELYYTVEIDQLPDGQYEIDIPNIANVDGDDTNDVLDEAYVGILVVKYVDYDGTELTETSVTRARVGTAYGSLPILDFENRVFDYVDGARVGNYFKGTITVVFHYNLIPATLTVKYIDKDTGAEIKPVDIYTGFNQGEAIPGTYAEEYPIDGYIYKNVVTPDPMQFVTPSAEIIHYYVRILDTDEPAVEKIANPASGELVKGGDTITYSIAVTNVRETDSLENVVVTDAVPAGTTVKSIANNGTESNGVVTWTIGSIAAGQTKVVSFTVTVDSGLNSGSNLGNVAKVSYKDIQTGEDKTVPTNPTGHALLTSVKTSSVPAGTILYAGDIITYNVSVTNIGTAAASNIDVYDTVPDGTGIILSTLTAGASYSNGKISYTIKNLQPGETKTLSFSVQVAPLADGEYAKVISNTAVVDGDNTNTTEDLVKRGTLTVKYQDTAGNTLADDIVSSGAVDTPFTLPAEKKFEDLRLKEVTRDNDSPNYIEGNITYIYIYERIPATAIVKYVDYNTGATLLESKNFNAYVGDILDSDYYENITHYNHKYTDKPSKLEYTEEGLVIIHYYEYVYDSATIGREKTASPASGSLVKTGDEITYTITVENPRYDAISNVIVTDAIPTGSTFVSADNGGTVSAGTVTWNVGTIEAGQSVAVSFTVKVDDSFESGSNLHNIAKITYTGAGDTEPKTVVTNDTYHAVLTYDKKVDASEADVLDVLTYSIYVKNQGSTKAENIVVTDNVPANTTLIENSTGGASYSNGTLTWNIAKLEPNESVTLTFKVKVDAMEPTEFREIISNKAKVNGEETNEVETVVTQGTVVVTHVTDKGIELRPAETATGEVGETFSFSQIESDVYKLKEINGEPNDTFVEGVKYVEFVYELREAGLVVNYLEYGTDKVLDDSVTETFKVNDKVTNIYEQEFIELDGSLYEFVTTTYEPDNSLVMTKDGIVVDHYYKLVPTGSVVVKYVDTAGNEIAPSDSSSGNIYETYSYQPKNIEGYIYSYVADGSDAESGNYPANDTNEIVYVYVRATGTLVVRYLELGTDKVLADNVSEVYNTGDTVTNLHEKEIDKYDYNSSDVPSSLVMTEDGIEIIHYYTLTPTGTATAHYVDREGNDLLDEIVKAGTIKETYSFSEQVIDGWHLVEIDGEETGNFPADSNNDVYYIYERDTGVLTVYYLEEGTNETLSQTYTETMHTGNKVEDLHERDIDLYELVASEIPADLTMTTEGLTITYWYRLIPTGDAVAKFVDTEGNPLADEITAAGNIYETYEFKPIDIPGYKHISTEGTEAGNFPANSTNEVIYIYERCVGNLTVNYLEKDTGLILAEQYTEVVPTLVEVTDLHEKTIAYYNLVDSEIPENLTMTEEGIVINYYYAQESTGTVTVHYVDEDYNPLLIPETVNGIVNTEYSFTPETIDGYVYKTTEGEPEGVITEEPKDVYFIYTREQGVLNISYLEEGTEKSLADSYTETMETGETVTDLRANSISGYVRTATDRPESLVMTTDGINIIHYYKAIPTGTVKVSYVDEEGNELIEGSSTTDFVDVEYGYEPEDIPGYELIKVEGEPEGVITEEDQEVKFIYKRLNGTLHITYIDKTTGEPVAESYNEVFDVGEVVKDLKEKDIDGYTLVDSEIPEDLTMTEDGLDVVYYYTPDTYTVSGTTWIEGNKNSTFDKNNDATLSDIKVVLYDGNKTIVGTDVTDRNGEFEIDGVKAGKYTVSFEVPGKYKVVDSLPYSADKTNSIANYTGDTGVLSVTGDTPNVGMGVEGIVLGSTATNEQEVVKPSTPQTVYTPTTSKQENATYTKVLGDTGINPSTGDNTAAASEDMTVIAVMLATCSLFVLTMTKKKGAAARR